MDTLYEKYAKCYLMLDVSNNKTINNYINIYKNLKYINIIKKSHFTFNTIIFNLEYDSVKKFLNNKTHEKNINNILLFYYNNCFLTPINNKILGNFYTKIYKLNNYCKKRISLCRKTIYTYIALYIMFSKEKAQKLFNIYMKDKKKYKDMLKCSTLKHKNNNDFISFIYTCKKTNKELNIFSVPKYLIKHNEIEFHLSLLNINNYIEILKKNIIIMKI